MINDEKQGVAQAQSTRRVGVQFHSPVVRYDKAAWFTSFIG
jgi:hypothetical protein